MGSRRKSRELALQMLFQQEMAKQSPEEVQRLFWASHGEVSEAARSFAEALFRIAIERDPEISVLLQKHAPGWRVERMAAVDRNILRAGVAEMLAYPTPAPVVINEALEIAHKFSTPESVNFINAVLDHVAGDLPGERGKVKKEKEKRKA